jgi:hypothetical protein
MKFQELEMATKRTVNELEYWFTGIMDGALLLRTLAIRGDYDGRPREMLRALARFFDCDDITEQLQGGAVCPECKANLREGPVGHITNQRPPIPEDGTLEGWVTTIAAQAMVLRKMAMMDDDDPSARILLWALAVYLDHYNVHYYLDANRRRCPEYGVWVERNHVQMAQAVDKRSSAARAHDIKDLKRSIGRG